MKAIPNEVNIKSIVKSAKLEKSRRAMNSVAGVQLDPEVEQALDDLFPSSDALDQRNFDPVEFLNSQFPTEASLGQGRLDQLATSTKARIHTLEEAIRVSIRQSDADTTAASLKKAADTVAELTEKIASVKAKAADSEAMVQDICADVKQLDIAKTNLTATFTALKRLHMLRSAVDQLQQMAITRQYRQASHLIDAIDDLFQHFQEFRKSTQIAVLVQRAKDYRLMLEEHIIGDFRSEGVTGRHGATSADDDAVSSIDSEVADNLKCGCQVLDVLGEEQTLKLLEWVSSKHLEAYLAIFEPATGMASDTTASWALDNTERRFAWLRRTLQRFQTNFGGVFPLGWNVAGRICHEFCIITHQHLLRVLNESRDRGCLDTQVLVRVLQRTIAFEAELDRYYADPDNVIRSYQDDPDIFDDDGDPNSAAAIKHKYKEISARNSRDSRSAYDSRYKCPKLIFRGLISKSFAAYMSQYVSLEHSNISNLLAKINKEEDWTGQDPSVTRLTKSDSLFIYIKKSMERASRLDRKKVLFDIFQEYKLGVQGYCEQLLSKIPTSRDLGEHQVHMICQIINSAEYCAQTLPQLQESIVKTIDEVYADRVDLEDETDEFVALIGTYIHVLVEWLMFELGGALRTLPKLPWEHWETVGDTSSYVSDIKTIFKSRLSGLAQSISPTYHFHLCNSLVAAFIPEYISALPKCKRINGLGAQQLLLDAQDLENELKRLPKIGLESSQQRIPGSFAKFVKKEMGKAVVLLKTVAADPSSVLETFRNLSSNGNFADLTRIMDLKGMKKSDQQKVIDAYNKSVPLQQQGAPFLRDSGVTSSTTTGTTFIPKDFKLPWSSQK